MAEKLDSDLDLMEYGEDEDTLKDRFFTFFIENQQYALELRDLVEIIGIQKVTEIPNVRPYIVGVINLRGSIVPIVDVRKRFELKVVPHSEKTCIVIIHNKRTDIGLIVDEVSEVITINPKSISAKPSTNKRTESRYISGIAKLDASTIILLNLDKLLND